MSQFTIAGRLVQGDLHKAGQPSKDPRTKQVKIDAKTGQPVQGQFFVAVAIPKNAAERLNLQGTPAWEATKAMLDADARAAWPQFFGTPAAGLIIGPELPAGCTNPKFANKVIDGDGNDENGQPYSAKEGYAGCWVVKVASQFAPKVYEWTASGWQETIHTGRVVKCGDYVSISGDCKTNSSDQSPGMYMNLSAATFEREGSEIKSTAAVDPNAAFGQRGGPTSAAHAASGQAAAHTTQGSTTASAGDAPPPPYTGYMDSDAPPPPSGPAMTAKANGKPYQSFIDKGWTDDQLRQHGYLA